MRRFVVRRSSVPDVPGRWGSEDDLREPASEATVLGVFLGMAERKCALRWVRDVDRWVETAPQRRFWKEG